jgi:hypothetical protein
MTSSALIDLSNRLGPVHRPDAAERATIRANIAARFGAEDAALLIEALGVRDA